MVGQMLSVVSMVPTSISNGLLEAGLQYPFILCSIQLEKLIHKPRFSVMGEIDLFSMLRTLLARLSGMLEEP